MAGASSLQSKLQHQLNEWNEAQLRRVLRVIQRSPLATVIESESTPCPTLPVQHHFGSNDYLGWSQHLQLIEASVEATRRYGTGAVASRLVGGTSRQVIELEQILAQWKKAEAALVFGSGFAAAMGTIPALMKSGDFVIVDKLAHACLIDGAKLSGATLRVFPHNDLIRLEKILRSIRSDQAEANIWIITESIFSMDGDQCPLKELVELKNRFGAWLLVDEAHSTGLFGKTGAGMVTELGLGKQVEVVMGTFSKALGSLGGFITGSQVLIDTLVNRARSFIYSTALPPGVIGANRAAVELAQGPEGAAARQRLQENITLFRKLCPFTHSATAIQPVICGSSESALERARALEEAGIYAPAIRYPSVARNSARLRITLSASHSPEAISLLAKALGSF